MINHQQVSESQIKIPKQNRQRIDEKQNYQDYQDQSSSQYHNHNTLTQNNDSQTIQNNQQNNVKDRYRKKTYKLQQQYVQEDQMSQKTPKKIKNINNNQCLLRTCLYVFILIILLGAFVLIIYQVNKSKKFGQNQNNGQITSVFLINVQERQAFQSIQSYMNLILHYYQDNRDNNLNRGVLKFNDILIGSHYKFNKTNQNKINQIKDRINKINKKPFRVQWIWNKNPQLDIQFIDLILINITTQYYFFSTAQYIYQSQIISSNQDSIKYLELSYNVLSSFPKISQVIFNQDKNNNIHSESNTEISFNFSPALHRTKDYRYLVQGFQSITGKSSTIIEAQDKLSQFYLSINLQAMRIDKSFGITKYQFSYQSNHNRKQEKQLNNKQIKEQIPNKSNLRPITTYLNNILQKIKKPRQIFDIKKLKQIKQLPICIVIIPSQKYSLSILKNSIKNQNYANYIIIEPPIQKNSDNYSKQNYYQYLNRIRNQCKLNSLVVFVKNPLLTNALNYLNHNHQTHVAFISYSKSQKSIQIHSFFYRIYELLGKNDFNLTNMPFLKQNNIQMQTLDFLEISRQFAIEVQNKKILASDDLAYFSISTQTQSKLQRQQYTGISRLSHDMPSTTLYFNSTAIANTSSSKGSEMTAQHMYRAIQRQQQWYLPQNHSIEQTQYIQLDQLYKISRYSNIQRQVRFCVTVLSRNNIQNDRYLKVLKSITQQKYHNYHIVFIDDKSTDKNMNASIQYLKSINFPTDRVTFVQNLYRNYATYNIINAAFNYCHEDDVQMLMDGDDQFIGRYAFQAMNSAYQLEERENQDVWVAYSNYKSNFNTFGISKKITSDQQHMARNRRLYVSIFGPVRTWRVKVVYNIPPLHHKQRNGKWLDTVYDDALSHPLFQLSSVRRIRYIPQILSEYNMKYGDNDDSTKEKIKHRKDTYRYVTSLTPLRTLNSLQGSVRDAAVVKQLNADRNIKYKTINM